MSSHLLRSAAAGASALMIVAAAARPARAEGFGVALEGGYYDMTNARNSAKAIFDDASGGPVFGVFARYGVSRSFFVGAGARLFQKSGERAFAADKNSPPFRLGHPLDVRIIPVYALLGYRLSPDSTLSPYLGLGAGLTSYREESTVAGEVTTDTASKPSFHGVVGLEYGLGKVRFAVEGMYMAVPNIIGEAGISKVYEEDDVGGFSVVGRVVFVP